MLPKLSLGPRELPDASELQQTECVVDGVDLSLGEVPVREEGRHLRSLRHVDPEREGREGGEQDDIRMNGERREGDHGPEVVAEPDGGELVAPAEARRAPPRAGAPAE